jgi:hypothetical protein
MKKNQKPIRLIDEWKVIQLNPTEDGAHQLPGKKFFEWWYFDAHFNNDHHLVIALHPRIFSVSSRPAVLTVHLYGPDKRKTIEVASFRPSEVESTVGQCNVRLGGSRAWNERGHFKVYVEQGSIRADLEYQRKIEGVRTGTGVLFTDFMGEQSFHWIIPIPRASVSGYLWIDDRCVAVTGVGYHDHNWGNLDLHRVIRRWSWGQVIADRHTVIFWEILGRGKVNSRAAGVMLWQGRDLLLNTNQVHLHPSESGLVRETDICGLDRIKAQVNDTSMAVQAVLKNRRTLDKIDFAQPRSRRESVQQMLEKIYFLSERAPLIGQLVKQLVGYGTYHRLQAECELRIATERYNGQAFYEIMDFGNLA